MSSYKEWATEFDIKPKIIRQYGKLTQKETYRLALKEQLQLLLEQIDDSSVNNEHPINQHKTEFQPTTIQCVSIYGGDFYRIDGNDALLVSKVLQQDLRDGYALVAPHSSIQMNSLANAGIKLVVVHEFERDGHIGNIPAVDISNGQFENDCFPNEDIPAYGWSTVEPTPKLKLVQCDSSLMDAWEAEQYEVSEQPCIQNKHQLTTDTNAMDWYMPECEFSQSSLVDTSAQDAIDYHRDRKQFSSDEEFWTWFKNSLANKIKPNYIISNFCLALQLRVVFEVVKSASLKIAIFRTEDLSQKRIFDLHQQYRLAQDCVCDNILLIPDIWLDYTISEYDSDVDEFMDFYLCLTSSILQLIQFDPIYILCDEQVEYSRMMDGLYAEQFVSIALSKLEPQEFYWDSDKCTLVSDEVFEDYSDITFPDDDEIERHELLADFLRG
ncbi:hypothetical protein [Nostoc sp. PA-18-2419]|uniref:hypothetical protein n=1 Tax=Nostoc sp. PA-18-2419 TaxID=2575443 RepID=UPI001107E13D|nr:hypothetical protein [Nostoc sp. PA-18-2419]